jgi:hypothetical protein
METKIIESLIYYITTQNTFKMDYWQTYGTVGIETSCITQAINQYRYHKGVNKQTNLNNLTSLLIIKLNRIGINCYDVR